MTQAVCKNVRIGDIVTVEYDDRDVLSALAEVMSARADDVAVRVVGVPWVVVDRRHHREHVYLPGAIVHLDPAETRIVVLQIRSVHRAERNRIRRLSHRREAQGALASQPLDEA